MLRAFHTQDEVSKLRVSTIKLREDKEYAIQRERDARKVCMCVFLWYVGGTPPLHNLMHGMVM